MKSRSLLALFVTAVFCSCSDKTTVVGNVSGTTGDLVGNVVIYSGSGSSYEPYFDSIVVHLEGSSFTGLTDSSGHWRIKDIPYGVYNISYAKSGFGITRSYGIAVTGNGTSVAPVTALERSPTDAVVLLSIDTVSIGQGRININASSTADKIGYCLDRSSDVKPEDVHCVAEFFNTFTLAELRRKGIHSGEHCYFSAFSISFHYGGEYDDLVNGGTRFASCGPKSNVLSFVMP